ncbi:DUF2384 domain-containing protein [Pseudoalteromonas sp. NGC95]|uniref:DUF2384 domain-containing protein n=1 Tax=Pseudoalteromonas sp. NGC95 TaxID=2792051 RepID=UPI0018CF2CFA|nr:DUF2384 domain-containing protein [Pseudoalteromonas sp. NGC95]MBH0015167.1 DUF2384 domain-containing protein [Pseudoalteromonas sp. NGC95]
MSLLKHEILNKNPKRTSEIALRVFFNIMTKWEVTKKEQTNLLGQSSEQLFKGWKQDTIIALSDGTLLRISYVLGIYKALGTLFSDKKLAHAWITRENQIFDNSSALDFILKDSANNLPQVRKYLDSQITDEIIKN